MTILCDRCGAEYDEALRYYRDGGSCEIAGDSIGNQYLCPICAIALQRWIASGPRKYKVVEVSECSSHKHGRSFGRRCLS